MYLIVKTNFKKAVIMAGQVGRPKTPNIVVNKNNARAVSLTLAGLTSDQIADLEGTSVRTIKARVKSGLNKLNLPDYVDLGNKRLYSLLHSSLDDIEAILKEPLTDENRDSKLRNAHMLLDKTLGFMQRLRLAEIKATAQANQPLAMSEDQEQLAFEGRLSRLLERRQALIEDSPNNGGINGDSMDNSSSGRVDDLGLVATDATDPDKPDAAGQVDSGQDDREADKDSR